MIEKAVAAGHATHLNTNATTLTPALSERLVKSGLDFIFFSFDDVSPEQFEIYRAGAKYDKVFENIRTFFEIRDRLGSEKPGAVLQP